jgi:predicted regulator of Ras-like GTPase activity (Roadblock/LC7/MglB family)
MLGRMDADQAIADLTEISPQVQTVVIVRQDGSVAGSNAGADEAARFAAASQRLLGAGDEVRSGQGLGPVAQLEVATTDGSVFVVRDGARVIVATTTPEPTVGLVFYDLKTCLRSVDPDPEPAARKPRSRARKPVDDAAA